MSEEYHALTVTLDGDYDQAHLEPVIEAIKMIKGVVAVDPHTTQFEDRSARQLVGYRYQQVLWRAFKAVQEGKDIVVVERQEP